MKWHIERHQRVRLEYSRLSCNYWCLAETAVDKAGVPGFIDALAVFTRQERAKARGVENAGDERRKEVDSSWSKKYPIQVHDFITTWKAKGDNRG